jgi:hypothetical protein
MQKKTNPIDKKEEVRQSNDQHITQDFPGFPHPPSSKKTIKPETPSEKKTAQVTKKKTTKTYGK